jgi:hypothetical protein
LPPDDQCRFSGCPVAVPIIPKGFAHFHQQGGKLFVLQTFPQNPTSAGKRPINGIPEVFCDIHFVTRHESLPGIYQLKKKCNSLIFSPKIAIIAVPTKYYHNAAATLYY